MAKKKKYVSMNEFRYNFDPDRGVHPHYIFARRGNFYKSFGLTTNPSPKFPHRKLLKNPNGSNDPSYIYSAHVYSTGRSKFGKILSGWKFHPYDAAWVKHKVRKYRKINK